MSELLHPELFATIPSVGPEVARRLDTLAGEAQGPHNSEAVSVVVRTLNEGQRLKALLIDINQQKFAGEVEVIVVDNESTDDTRDVAEQYGAKVVTIGRDEFTYPRSMNRGIAAASHDLIWMTVGHALPTTTGLLQAGADHFNDETVGGVYAMVNVPNDSASLFERMLKIETMDRLDRPADVTKVSLGTMGATSAMLRKQVWERLGTFDERYEAGGEDSAMAVKMLAAGLLIKRHPLLSVHHSHGLGPVAYLKQLHGWSSTLQGPQLLNRNILPETRPHLRYK